MRRKKNKLYFKFGKMRRKTKININIERNRSTIVKINFKIEIN